MWGTTKPALGSLSRARENEKTDGIFTMKPAANRAVKEMMHKQQCETCIPYGTTNICKICMRLIESTNETLLSKKQMCYPDEFGNCITCDGDTLQ